MPVVRIDGRPVGNGAPGLIATALRRDYHRHAEVSLRCAGKANNCNDFRHLPAGHERGLRRHAAVPSNGSHS